VRTVVGQRFFQEIRGAGGKGLMDVFVVIYIVSTIMRAPVLASNRTDGLDATHRLEPEIHQRYPADSAEHRHGFYRWRPER
jgi:hypothetical protein